MTDKTSLAYLWCHGENEDFKKTVLNSWNNSVLVKLKYIISQEHKALLTKQLSKKNYESPSWAFEQADLNGEIRAVEQVLSLLNFVKD